MPFGFQAPGADAPSKRIIVIRVVSGKIAADKSPLYTTIGVTIPSDRAYCQTERKAADFVTIVTV